MAASAQANDSLSSELPHAAGGMAWGAVGTWVASDRWPEHRMLIGIGVAASAGLLGELIERAQGSGFSPLDILATAMGGAIGAYVTDRFILMPVVERPQQGGHYIGVTAHYRF